jgi:hypothetical protein
MTPAAFVERLRAGDGHPLLRGRQPRGATTEFSGLQLQVTEIRCVKDTREIGKDEIANGGALLDLVTGAATEVPSQFIGKFKKGDVKSFPNPLRFPPFNLHANDEFPKVYMAVLALAEIDLGGFGKFLTDLANALHGITVGLLAVVVGAAAAGVGVGTGAVLSGIRVRPAEEVVGGRDLRAASDHTGGA